MEYIGFAASFVMGIILGVMGGGGSILTVPILVYVFALSPLIATGYSLFIVGMAALIGSLAYFRQREIRFDLGFAFAVPSVIGVQISRAVILPSLPPVVFHSNYLTISKELLVMFCFAALMLAASLSMIFKKTERRHQPASPLKKFLAVVLLGFLVGVVAGFVGAGGGFLIIPALVFVAGLSMRVAVGTSLMIIAIQSLFGFASDIWRGLDVDWTLLTLIALCAAAGILLGSRIANRLPEQKLKPAFGGFVLVIGFLILIEQLRHLLN